MYAKLTHSTRTSGGGGERKGHEGPFWSDR